MIYFSAVVFWSVPLNELAHQNNEAVDNNTLFGKKEKMTTRRPQMHVMGC